VKTLTTILTLLTISTNAQSFFTEYSLKGEALGIQLFKHKNTGFYISTGGNYLAQLFAFNQTWESDYKDHFTSSVDWYGPSGAYLPTYDPSPITTSPEWGNVLLESGTYRKISETIEINTKTVYQTYNMGVVFPVGEIKVRLGGGVFITTKTGEHDYWKITQTGRVEKYYDELQILGNSQHLFVVEYNPSFRDVRTITPIHERKVAPNLHAALIFPLHTYSYHSTDLTLGVSGNTLTFGLNYNL
jgi:hypothetical protein